ncbi:uncharacterized protein E0L32_000177 [Thyridium curvatum]|uniref:Uncharacterized protein n=1 Tax=Thyridium curvatum TaxID=1093900 RepID=A0A507B824_9PEZI|nr:uncharacterized protein E0L32_000177 [Thyridium curvatum]TPX15843.1 hypothetical protein E0L32_000177 [Thyridium curvatum]
MAESVVQVRVFTYQTNPINSTIMPDLVQLAYKTAIDKGLAPTTLLIRSILHKSTKGGPDPQGYHVTLSIKYPETPRDNHVTAHGYTPGRDNYQFVSATFGDTQIDATPRRGFHKSKGEKVVWPDLAGLVEWENSPVTFPAPPAPKK